MRDAADSPANSSSPDEPSRSARATFDTSAGSVLHRIAGCCRTAAPGQAYPLTAIFLAAIAITFVPLLVGAYLGPLSLTNSTAPHRLPFLRDWNVLFLYLVSFPSLAVLIVNDQWILSTSLKSVEQDGTLTLSEEHANQLRNLWEKRFRAVNWGAQIAGAAIGAVVAYFNYRIYVPASVGYWIAADGRLLAVGYIYLYCIFLFYCFVPIYIVRSAAIAFLLNDIVARAQLRMLPLHPDNAGGLQPMGHVGLRNQYLLTIFGLNIVILVAVSYHYLDVPPGLFGLIAAATIAYLILGPLTFVAPLLPFRKRMLEAKTELMADVARRMRLELQRLHAQLKSGEITEDDEKLVDRLRKIGAMIDELPVWPFDALTIQKFFVAYIVPLVSSVGYPVATWLFDYFKDHFI